MPLLGWPVGHKFMIMIPHRQLLNGARFARGAMFGSVMGLDRTEPRSVCCLFLFSGCFSKKVYRTRSLEKFIYGESIVSSPREKNRRREKHKGMTSKVTQYIVDSRKKVER